MNLTIGIAEMELSRNPNEILITYSLSSCVGLTLYDPTRGIGGMIHCMLPLSKMNVEKAQHRPCMFVDTGVSLLLKGMFNLGSDKKDLLAKVAGGARLVNSGDMFRIGERNYTVLRKILWKNNILNRGRGRRRDERAHHGAVYGFRQDKHSPCRHGGGIVNRRMEILDAVLDIPALPSVAVQAIQLLQNPETDAGMVNRTLQCDPGLAANVLRLANSALFGGGRTISSLQEAIARLGAKNISDLVLATAVAPVAKKEVRGYHLAPGDLWEHSMAVAVGTIQFERALGLQAPSYAFTAGLLHDVGKIVLGSFVEIDAAPIMALAFQQNIPFDEAEEKVLGVSHAEIGAALLESWQIPAGLGAGADGSNYSVSKESMQRLGVEAPTIEQVASSIFSELEATREIFSASVGR